MQTLQRKFKYNHKNIQLAILTHDKHPSTQS